MATYAYHVSEFQHHFKKIKIKDLCIVTYLEEIGVEKWSRAFFPGVHYNVMTSNYAESFNSKSRDARKYLITTFADFLRFALQDCFYKRKGSALACNGPLATNIEK